jgi:exocyst complex component 7
VGVIFLFRGYDWGFLIKDWDKQGERTLWSQVFQRPSSTGLTSIFSSPVNLLSDLLTTQTSIIRKSLSIHTFYALELYQSLLRIQPRWEEACRDWTGDLKALTMIGDASTVLRGVCLRSFPEILVDVKNPPPASRVSDGPSVGVADVTYSVGVARGYQCRVSMGIVHC